MKDDEDDYNDHPILGSPRGPRIGLDVGNAAGFPAPRVVNTLQFPIFLRPAELLSPLSEISDKVPIRGHIVSFS